jgi:hypothetical protein
MQGSWVNSPITGIIPEFNTRIQYHSKAAMSDQWSACVHCTCKISHFGPLLSRPSSEREPCTLSRESISITVSATSRPSTCKCASRLILDERRLLRELPSGTPMVRYWRGSVHPDIQAIFPRDPSLNALTNSIIVSKSDWLFHLVRIGLNATIIMQTINVNRASVRQMR